MASDTVIRTADDRDIVEVLRNCREGDWTPLLNRAADEIEQLRKALRPFADAHHSAVEFLSRCGDNHSVMESNGLYMWHAPRTLSASRFHAAVTALGEKL